jgi:hypothetical protein
MSARGSGFRRYRQMATQTICMVFGPPGRPEGSGKRWHRQKTKRADWSKTDGGNQCSAPSKTINLFRLVTSSFSYTACR